MRKNTKERTKDEIDLTWVLVFAVPSAPTTRTGPFWRWTVLMTCCALVESIVGTSRFEKSSLSPPGYVHCGGFHGCHSPVLEST